MLHWIYTRRYDRVHILSAGYVSGFAGKSFQMVLISALSFFMDLWREGKPFEWYFLWTNLSMLLGVIIKKFNLGFFLSLIHI